MRLSLSYHSILLSLFLAMITKSLACVIFEGYLQAGDGSTMTVWADIWDNTQYTCGANGGTFLNPNDIPIPNVPVDQTFVFLSCLPGYYATFQWGNPPTVWYETPFMPTGSFGLVQAADNIPQYSAKVWGC